MSEEKHVVSIVLHIFIIREGIQLTLGISN